MGAASFSIVFNFTSPGRSPVQLSGDSAAIRCLPLPRFSSLCVTSLANGLILHLDLDLSNFR